jgi:hypothetical protein
MKWGGAGHKRYECLRKHSSAKKAMPQGMAYPDKLAY